MPQPVRVRLAPSPTGNLHVGTARTALYNYLYARRHSGTYILRLEDTDEVRSQEEFTKDIIEGLKWLGIPPDEGPEEGGPYAPYKQSQRLDQYSKFADQLMSSGSAYLCYCSPEELEAMKDAQKAKNEPARYDNRCRNLTSKQIDHFNAQGRVPAIRFKFEEPRVVTWHDDVKGEVSVATHDLGGDLVILKSSGIATYNFAATIDDITMKITHVIRGEDHVHNTAKQILIYEALGVPLPKFAHVPLMFDIDRRKLSKRKHGEIVHVAKYRKDGYMPEAMNNYLAQISWTPPDGHELFTIEEASRVFDLSKVSKSPAVFDIQRLNWFNGHYIRSLPLSLITDRALPYLSPYDVNKYSRSQLEQIVACTRDGLSFLAEITAATEFFFQDKIEISQELRESVLEKEPSTRVLEKLLSRLLDLPSGDAPGCKAIVEGIGKELGIKGKDLYWPIRIALSGSSHGPDLGSTLSILSKEQIKKRIEAARQLCSTSV